LPHCDVFADDDYTKEEIKLMKEPKKIMGDDTFNLTATAVRVPVQGGHSESVNIEFENEFDLEEVRKIFPKRRE
jgi:aspartate-semialdehyde dehydrogenase